MGIFVSIAREAEEAIRSRVFPGCVIGFVRTNGNREIYPFGNFTYEADAQQVTAETIYDVASITKSIPTACLALQLIERGQLKLYSLLKEYIPEFSNSDRDSVSIKHLLTYTLDGYGLARHMDKDKDGLLQLLLTKDFEQRPGTVFKYTNIPAALLGLVIEKVTGESLDVLAQREFFTPLGMNSTTFHPETLDQSLITPTEIDHRGEVRGAVHDESAHIFKQGGKVMGHAGIFSTANDLLHFMEMLLNKGNFAGKKYFSEELVDLMATNQIAELNDYTGLGWELYQPRYMGEHCGEHTFGKTGFTGTLVVADVEKGIAYVILSNRIYPKRPETSAAINAFRASIGNILL